MRFALLTECRARSARVSSQRNARLAECRARSGAGALEAEPAPYSASLAGAGAEFRPIPDVAGTVSWRDEGRPPLQQLPAARTPAPRHPTLLPPAAKQVTLRGKISTFQPATWQNIDALRGGDRLRGKILSWQPCRMIPARRCVSALQAADHPNCGFAAAF